MQLSLHIFRNRNFALYWLAMWLSSIGDSVFIIALTWMLVEKTGSPIIVGTYLFIVGLTKVAFVLVGGLVVDRLNVRKLLIYSDWVRALVMVVFAAFALQGLPPIWVFYVTGFIFGLVDSVATPAGIFVATQIVPQEHYTQSMSIFLVTENVSTMIGPMIGAALLVWGSGVTAIAINGLSFVISAILLTFMRVDMPQRSHTSDIKTVMNDLREGFGFFLRNRIITLMAMNAFFANAAMGMTMLATPFLVLELDMGVKGYGLIRSGLGVGGAIGAALLSLFIIPGPTPRMALTTSLCQGLLILVLAFTGEFWLVALIFLLIGLNEAAVNVIAPSVNHVLIPRAVFGRVISVMMIVMDGAEPLSQLTSGWLMESVSVRQIFLLGGALEIVVAGIIFFLPVVRYYSAIEATNAPGAM
jgi:MFS transporter, DHA3 family, macrolide efflux protein